MKKKMRSCEVRTCSNVAALNGAVARLVGRKGPYATSITAIKKAIVAKGWEAGFRDSEATGLAFVGVRKGGVTVEDIIEGVGHLTNQETHERMALGLTRAFLEALGVEEVPDVR